MKNITDEILNKYIDGELDSMELNELNHSLNDDPDAIDRLKALRLTHQILKKMEPIPAPENFTDRVMARMSVGSKRTKQVNTLFIGVVSFFSLCIFVVLGFAISELVKIDMTDSASTVLYEDVKNKIIENVEPVRAFLMSDNILFISGMISLFLLIGLYFMVHTHKEFRKSLENFGHKA
ncbi:MAG: hypothetical protein KKA84_05170 [Bacteroidetes bacterium]|nr:hypothetical protein [Bacteroidota bacterium]